MPANKKSYGSKGEGKLRVHRGHYISTVLVVIEFAKEVGFASHARKCGDVPDTEMMCGASAIQRLFSVAMHMVSLLARNVCKGSSYKRFGFKIARISFGLFLPD